MVKTLMMKCPGCGQTTEVFLSTNACMIILNCPSCFSPIMYFENKIFLLTNKQVNEIKGSTQNTNIIKMLDKIAHPEHTLTQTQTAKKLTAAQQCSSCSETTHGYTHSYKPVREKYICEDDITNLRIELALSNDVGQFLESI